MPPAANAANAANAATLREAGHRLLLENRPAEALAVLLEAVQRFPDDVLARLSLARLCLRLQEPAAAEEQFRVILARVPDSEAARSGLVDVALARNDIARASQMVREMFAFDAGSAVALAAAARVAEMAGDHDDALVWHDRLVAAAPDDAGHRYHRARALLRLGRWEEGWRDYECRFAAGAVALATPPSPRWRGEAVGHLLLLAEQGFGDTIQFARLVPLVRERAAHVTLACPAPLAALLGRSLGIDTVAGAPPWPPHDAHLTLMSLPHVLGLGPRAAACEGRLLHPDPARVARWRERLALPDSRLAVGLAGTASAAHATEQRPQTRRSCRPGDLAPLAALPGVEFIAIGGDGATLPNVRPLPQPVADFDDTAAIVSLLDAVVSVDTAVAHVAGALGRPLALLLPFAADWRWATDAGRTDWYPTARLFRQHRAGEWSEPMAAVAAWIREMARQTTGEAKGQR